MSEQQHCTPSTGDNDVVEASATVTRSGTQRYIIAAVTWILIKCHTEIIRGAR